MQHEPPIVEPADERDRQDVKSWMDSRSTVFALLFCVTGFLGLPCLWKSKAFSQAEKWIWSVIVTVYTLALIAITCLIVSWSIRTISQTVAGLTDFQLFASDTLDRISFLKRC